jgi:predicted transcriptional regulator
MIDSDRIGRSERLSDSDHEYTTVRAMADLLTPITVRLAATLRVPDLIAGGRTTVEELADDANVDASTFERILAHMVTIGLLERNAENRFSLTTRGEALREDHPSGLRSMLDMTRALGRAELSFVHLLHSARTGAAAYQKQYGVPLWYDLETNPDLRSSYDQEMSVDVSTWAPAIISSVDWSRVGSVLDVGGGDGTLLIEMLKAFPTLHGGVLDLPGTAKAAEEKLRKSDLADRATAIAGSFFDQLPQGYGGYILTAIVHDWDDPDARMILKRCADAASDSGRVFVIEKIGADGETPNTGMDLRLLAYLGGRERSLAELIALCESARLRLIKAHRSGAISILELASEAAG